VDITWEEGIVYSIGGDIHVKSGATLTILPGTVIKFASNKGLYVEDGTLIAEGTAEKPITFTALAETPAKGAWLGLVFSANTLNNTSLKYCNIEYAGGNSEYGAIHMDGCKININNCKITNSKYNGIDMHYSDAEFVSFANNEIKDVDAHALYLSPKAISTIGSGNIFTCNAGYGIKVSSGKFYSGAKTWSKQTVPYIVEGEVSINDGATVTIQAGNTIKFDVSGSMVIGYESNGTLVAEGTATEPIIFTSSATSPVAGAWTGLYFYGNAISSKMKYCKIEYAGKAAEYGAIYLADASKIDFDYNTIDKSASYGIVCYGSDAGFNSFTYNNILNVENHAISINAKQLHGLGANNQITTKADKGIKIDGGDYNDNSKTWLKQTVPFYVTSSVYILGGSLTIQPGCTFKADAGVWFEVGYSNNTTLTAEGTAAEKITFTSSATSPAAGAWKGLYFYSNTSSNTSLNYVDIAYAGNEYASIVLADNVNIKVNNTNISNSGTCGIYKYSGSAVTGGANNTFVNNSGNDICE